VADFYIDNDIPIKLAQELITLGHTASTTRALGVSAAGDQMHLRTAAEQGRILVTHNKGHFLLLHAAWIDWSMPYAHAGILIMKQQKLLAPQMALAIDRFIKSGQPLANQAYEWTVSGRWIRH
jgi:hypothetical protein